MFSQFFVHLRIDDILGVETTCEWKQELLFHLFTTVCARMGWRKSNQYFPKPSQDTTWNTFKLISVIRGNITWCYQWWPWNLNVLRNLSVSCTTPSWIFQSKEESRHLECIVVESLLVLSNIGNTFVSNLSEEIKPSSTSLVLRSFICRIYSRFSNRSNPSKNMFWIQYWKYSLFGQCQAETESNNSSDWKHNLQISFGPVEPLLT